MKMRTRVERLTMPEIEEPPVREPPPVVCESEEARRIRKIVDAIISELPYASWEDTNSCDKMVVIVYKNTQMRIIYYSTSNRADFFRIEVFRKEVGIFKRDVFRWCAEIGIAELMNYFPDEGTRLVQALKEAHKEHRKNRIFKKFELGK